jgi:succinyl-diaminopimelate desuccinylase
MEKHLNEATAYATDLLGDLVGIATINPPGGNYPAMCDRLRQEFGNWGVAHRELRVPKAEVARFDPALADYPRPMVLANWAVGAGLPTVHFNAHYDVVRVGDGWKSDPFVPRLERGRLFGRGTSDMKAAIVAMFVAVRALREAGVEPACNVEFSFTPDEETGGDLGPGWLCRSGKIRPDLVIVGEGACKGNVCVAHRGVLWLEVDVHGKAAHASDPFGGVNSFEALAPIIDALSKHREQLGKRKSRFVNDKGEPMTPTLMMGGQFRGPAAGNLNTIPDFARFTIDRRVLPEENLETAERRLCGVVERGAKRAGKVKVATRTVLRVDPAWTSARCPELKQFARCFRTAKRRDPNYVITGGFLDMRWFRNTLGAPTLGYGVDGKGGHAANESVRISDLLATAKVYAAVMQSYGTAG